jgi:hypothetical protein
MSNFDSELERAIQAKKQRYTQNRNANLEARRSVAIHNAQEQTKQQETANRRAQLRKPIAELIRDDISVAFTRLKGSIPRGEYAFGMFIKEEQCEVIVYSRILQRKSVEKYTKKSNHIKLRSAWPLITFSSPYKSNTYTTPMGNDPWLDSGGGGGVQITNYSRDIKTNYLMPTGEIISISQNGVSVPQPNSAVPFAEDRTTQSSDLNYATDVHLVPSGQISVDPSILNSDISRQPLVGEYRERLKSLVLGQN